MDLKVIEQLAIPEVGAMQELLPRLMGEVFHVSKASNLESIKEASAIFPNKDGRLNSSFGASSNSYFKNRNCVSVFDYRNPPGNKFDQFMGRCRPTLPAGPKTPIVIFYLGKAAIKRLLPWTGWKSDGHPSEMILPYLEAGHPGAIPLEDIEEILEVELIEDPKSMISIMRKARAKHR